MANGYPDWPLSLSTPMMGRKHMILPRSSSVRMESRRQRIRRLFPDSLELIEVTWNFTADEYAAFRTFFMEDLEQGTLFFTMETRELTANPEFIRIYTRDYAFLDGTYSFTSSDNVFTVQATLQIGLDSETYTEVSVVTPELPVTYESETCRELVVLAWAYTPGDELQTAWNQAGPWYEYIYPILTPAEISSGGATKTVKLNNTFQGQRWFRVIDNIGDVKYAAVRPQGPSVNFPTLEVSNTAASPRDMLTCPLATGETATEEDAILKPFSYIEDSILQPFEYYIEPIARLKYSRPLSVGLDTLVTVVTEDGTTKWTRNKSDPVATTAIPRFNGIDGNAYVFGDDFSGEIRARCFNGLCKSPVALYIVDKHYDAESFVLITNRAGSAGKWCLQIDGSGYSCSLIGGQGAMLPQCAQLACVNMGINQDDGHAGTLVITSKFEEELTDQKLYYPALASITRVWYWRFRSLAITRRPDWDKRPSIYEYFYALAEGNTSEAQIVDKVSGPDGQITEYENLLTALCATVDGSCPPNNTNLSEFKIICSCYNENFEQPVTAPDLPAAPEPPEPDPGYYELWDQDYNDGDPLIQILDGGTGWDGPWVLTEKEVLSGFEEWEEYQDGAVTTDSSLSGGDGWYSGGYWIFNDAIEMEGYETWESYVDGAIDFSDPTLYSGGRRWQVDVLGYQKPWILRNEYIGKEDWESYADQVLSEASVLNTDDGSWVTPWIFNE